MRLSYALLVAASALLATSSALSPELDAGRRSLRSIETVHNDDAAEEERAGVVAAFYHKFDFNLLDDVLHRLPEQFQRMRTEPETLRNMFKLWKTSYMSVDDVVIYMTREGLSEKAISQFKTAYEAYIVHAVAVAKAARVAKAAKTAKAAKAAAAVRVH
ncbi:hypothetical protein PHYPSEUDO_005163 [Phytophthora pseudosyringae]|uniref:RxLR effector protein n=1 Tax=Phytophthora pseudosyringae TaxID=221518 RepID=A0A8T1VLJ9_9STRA|nr:hypothetical protein PHYPSEUDO_005163 [Phytophthora pseudosyringae]